MLIPYGVHVRKIKIKTKVENIQKNKELEIKYHSSRDIRKLFEDDKDYKNERTSENKNFYNIINKHENKSKTATNLKSFIKMNTMEAFSPKSQFNFEHSHRRIPNNPHNKKQPKFQRNVY